MGSNMVKAGQHSRPPESAPTPQEIEFRAHEGAVVMENQAGVKSVFARGHGRASSTRWKTVFKLAGSPAENDPRVAVMLVAAAAMRATDMEVPVSDNRLLLASLSACSVWNTKGYQVGVTTKRWLRGAVTPSSLLDYSKDEKGGRNSGSRLALRAHVIPKFTPALPGFASGFNGETPSERAVRRTCAWLEEYAGWHACRASKQDDGKHPVVEYSPARLPEEASRNLLVGVLRAIGEQARNAQTPEVATREIVKRTVKMWSLLQYGRERPPPPDLSALAGYSPPSVPRSCAFCRSRVTCGTDGCCNDCGLFIWLWEDG